MAKRKREEVVPEMRDRLLANRDGRMTSGQWLDLIVQPLVVLALLLGVAFVVFGELLLSVAADFWWVGVPLILLLVFVPIILRGYRYARAPVHFAHLYATGQGWFWRPLVFLNEDDERV